MDDAHGPSASSTVNGTWSDGVSHTPRLAQHSTPAQARNQFGRHEDVVQAAPTVGCPPVARPIAPPGVESLFGRNEVADRVDPGAGLDRAGQRRDFQVRLRDHGPELLVRPDVGVQGGDVDVADEDRARMAPPPPAEEAGEFGEKRELVGEARIGLGVGNVAAGGDVDVVISISLPWAAMDTRVAAIGATAPRRRCSSSSRGRRRGRSRGRGPPRAERPRHRPWFLAGRGHPAPACASTARSHPAACGGSSRSRS